MFLNRLRLENFRRFKDVEVKFAKRLSVLVGINGAGKSSILSAISTLLSRYVRRLVSPSGTGAGTAISERDITTDALSCTIALAIDDVGREVSWAVSKTAKGAPIFDVRSDLKTLTEYVKDLRASKLASVPIIAAYTVNRSVLDIPLRIKKHHEFSVLSA